MARAPEGQEATWAGSLSAPNRGLPLSLWAAGKRGRGAAGHRPKGFRADSAEHL